MSLNTLTENTLQQRTSERMVFDDMCRSKIPREIILEPASAVTPVPIGRGVRVAHVLSREKRAEGVPQVEPTRALIGELLVALFRDRVNYLGSITKVR